MHHPDEQTLAYHAMGMDLSPAEQAAIEDHLHSCAGCRLQVEELREINGYVADRIAAGTDPSHTYDALARMPRPPVRRSDAPPIAKPPRMVTRMQRMTGALRRHPISTGSGIILLGLLSFAAIKEVTVRKITVEQPASLHINAVGSALEVFGDRNTKLWEIPISPKFRSASSDEMALVHSTRICDLDGDGDMEVVTGAPYLDGDNLVSTTIRIFSHDGQVQYLPELGRASTFDSSVYANNFSIAGLVVTTPAGSHANEIFVALTNDRSPSFLVRLTIEGKIIGEYWHFGWEAAPHIVKLAGEDHDLILLTGVNDVGYRTNQIFPALVVLDPAAIVGRTESPRTRGFGLSESGAEVYYVTAGNADPRLISGTVTHRPGFVFGVKVAPDSTFTIAEKFMLPVDFPGILYTFDASLALGDIWFSDTDRILLTDRFLTRKSPEGQEEFRRDMWSKVRWWDGTAWQVHPAKIKRTPPGS
jgi:hypothetical protein